MPINFWTDWHSFERMVFLEATHF